MLRDDGGIGLQAASQLLVSRRTGQAGYAPACQNKFVPAVCGLPKVMLAELREDNQRLAARMRSDSTAAPLPACPEQRAAYRRETP